MKKLTKVALGVAIGALSVGALSVAANAFWTAPGTGTGSGAAGGNSPVVVFQTTDLTGLAPGSTGPLGIPLSGTFKNTNASSVHVNTLTATVGSVTKAADAPTGTCDATDFTIIGSPMTVNLEVLKNTTDATWPTSGGTLAILFNNKLVNQDACKGATVTLSYVAS